MWCGLGQRTDKTAEAMVAVTALGWEIRVRWEPPWKRVMCECARLAMASSEVGVMIWSPVLMKYQEGMVFHAAVLDGVLKAAWEAPRWEACRPRCPWSPSPSP